MRKMLRYETALWSTGIQHVAGVDEGGMSPLAGPVAAAAVILPPEVRISRVDDSKKLDPATREDLAAEIKAKATAWQVGFATVLKSIRSISTGTGCWPCAALSKDWR